MEPHATKKIYILASSPSDLTEMVDLADILTESGNMVTLAYFNEGGVSTLDPKINAKIQDIQNSAATVNAYILEPNPSIFDYIVTAKKWLRKNKAFRTWKYAILKSLIFLKGIKRKYIGSRRSINADVLDVRGSSLFSKCLEVVYLMSLYHRNLRTFRMALQRDQFDVALIPEDVVGSVWPLFIKAAHEIDIPTLVFPYTLANQKEAVQSLRVEPAFQSKNNRIAAWFFPTWRWRVDDLDIVRLPSGHIFAHEFFDVSPPAPWLMNSGFANAICVDSPASLEYFINSGIPKSKLFVTGSVSQDYLFTQKARKAEALAELLESLGLVGEKPLLLISGCPNQLAGKVPHCEFATVEEVAHHLGLALAPLRDAFHIVVRPHPNFLQFGELMQPYGVVSTLVPTSRLVPLADLFIGFASATIRWAIACAVPTVNYDIFHYCYNDFGNADGVITLTDADAFESILASLLPGGDMHSGLKAKIEGDSKFWSCLDGCSVDRIQAAINSECAKAHTVRTSH